ncbi:MAG: DUF2953 domain-containing protein [Anaerolineae bacterium]|nr:DUF2953 domain-containing protein [Anaerolineae bacterium]
MSGVLIAIAGSLTLLVLLLAVPFDVDFRLRGMQEFSGQVTVGWLYGLLRFRIPVNDASKPRTSRPAAGRRNRKRGRKWNDGGKGRDFFAILRRADFRREIYRFVKDICRAVHLHELGFRMRLGLGDPADTGRLWAFVGPLNVAAQSLRNARIVIEPEFMEAVIEFDTHGRFRIVPLQMLALAIAFALSAPSRRAWRTLRGADA